jgi:hypothetical protein
MTQQYIKLTMTYDSGVGSYGSHQRKLNNSQYL